MSSRKAMNSVLQLFAGFSFFAAAIFFFSLPFLPKVRLLISDALLSSPKVCTPIGIGFLIASIVLLAGFYSFNRGRSLVLKMGGNTSSVDSEVVHKTLEEYVGRSFAGQIVLSGVDVLRGNTIEIELSFAPIEEGVREELFAAVQDKIRPLLEERFGYRKPFILVVKNQTSLKSI